jgi:hypothetical protein
MASYSFGFIMAAMFKDKEKAMQMFPIIALPFMIVSGYLAQVRSMLPYMMAYSYLSPFKWGFQAMVSLEMFENGRSDTWAANCVALNKSTGISSPVNAATTPNCVAKNIYNFYEDTFWFNVGMNGVGAVLWLLVSWTIFYNVYKQKPINHDDIPEDLKDEMRPRLGLQTQSKKFDWAGAESQWHGKSQANESFNIDQ